MQSLQCLTVAVVVAVGAMAVLTWTAPNPSVAINFHFVPAVLPGRCNMTSRFTPWQPPNMKCTNCYCLTGTLSRCVPMTGCNPNLPTNSSATTVDPNAPTESTMGQGNPVAEQTTPGSTTAAAAATAAPAAANTTTAAPSG